MPQGITGQVNTYNAPNYVGELFNISPEDTPFLSAIGGLTGGESTGSTLFEWQTHDLRDAETDRQRLEGADAPEGGGRARGRAYNVVEIHQEAVAVSYTKQGTTRQRNTDGSDTVQIGNTIIPADELSWQIDQELKAIARDVERTFIEGEFQNPSDNTAPRRTRGLLEAIETNVATIGSAEEFDDEVFLDLVQLAWDNGGVQESETRTVIVNSQLKRRLTREFIRERGYAEETRTVGGVNLQVIETDFGRFNVMLNRWMPQDQLAVVSLEECAPRFLEVPDKGHFFVEPLAKTGAADRVQLYGEIGLKYGAELKHAKLVIAEPDGGEG